MIWFYRRDRMALSLETRYDNDTSDYVAVVIHPDGRRETQRFERREAFRVWLQAFENGSRLNSGRRTGPRISFLMDGLISHR